MTGADDQRDDAEPAAFSDGPLPAATRITKRSGGAATVLGAAMIAVGEILEPQNARVELEQPADASGDDSGLDLTFGDLPPIDDL